jgi:hypothetical protein
MEVDNAKFLWLQVAAILVPWLFWGGRPAGFTIMAPLWVESAARFQYSCRLGRVQAPMHVNKLNVFGVHILNI